jgi:hypothetical protein
VVKLTIVTLTQLETSYVLAWNVRLSLEKFPSGKTLIVLHHGQFCETMPFNNSLSSTTMIVGGLLAALTGAQPAPAMADVWYPWCLHGETSRCYYTSREQCEQSADYRGICYPNPLSRPLR